jgi:hypothetical protein
MVTLAVFVLISVLTAHGTIWQLWHHEDINDEKEYWLINERLFMVNRSQNRHLVL